MRTYSKRIESACFCTSVNERAAELEMQKVQCFKSQLSNFYHNISDPIIRNHLHNFSILWTPHIDLSASAVSSASAMSSGSAMSSTQAPSP